MNNLHNILPGSRPLVTLLAVEFIERLSHIKGFREMAWESRTRKRQASCLSHDICDANEVMEQAFVAVVGKPSDTLNDEAHFRLWNLAWNVARKYNFNMSLFNLWTELDHSTKLRVSHQDNAYHKMEDDKYRSWDKSVETGHSYLVGRSMTREEFLASHTSRLSAWMQLAFHLCVMQPEKCLRLVGPRLEWLVYARGEYVTFSLPYHDHGGEKDWISVDGKTKVLINVD